MKDIRFNISLYVIIPVIFAGIAILSIIVTYNTTTYYLSKALNPQWPVAWWGMLLIAFTLIQLKLSGRWVYYEGDEPS